MSITMIVLLYLIAWWAVITGVLEIAAAIRLRKVIAGDWMMAFSGAASIALGVLRLLFPAAGALALVFWIGVYALVTGAMQLFLGLKLRTQGGSHLTARPTPSPDARRERESGTALLVPAAARHVIRDRQWSRTRHN